MKKNRLIVISLCFLLLLLSACSGGAKESSGSSDKKKDEKKEDEVVEIKYFNWDADQTAINQIIADFEKENPNIKVKSEVLIPGGSAVDNMTRMDVLMSAGEQVDVVSIPNVDQAVLRAANGMFEPLDGYFKKDGIDIKKDYLINASYKGKVYALPHLTNYWYILLNKDDLDEAGLSVPKEGWTWDDFAEYAKKLTKGEGKDKRYGVYFHTWGEYANPMLFTEKAHPYMKDEKTSIFNDKSFDYWFDFRRNLEKAGAIKPYSDVIGSELNYRTEFFNEKASMLMTASWTVADVGNIEKYPHDFKTAFAPMPRMSKDSPIGTTNIAGEFSAVAKNSKHKEAAYKFLKYVTGEGSQTRGLSSWTKVDGKATINKMVAGKEKYYDVDSLLNTLFNDKVKGAYTSDIAISYGNELKKDVLEAGFTKYMLDGISVKEAKQWMVDEANKIIETNKK
ncbi:ABC transporter substrate-binding protein [Neobacillus dielmonensis]|uniref:ABC transporter substrate-binding protein n=1 Tax=Neobacillus dielmonensis TaxID=1347369 RepID=UPI0005A8DB43|nr:extracellular solute-binding protein [Neobacillus dielmonensis]